MLATKSERVKLKYVQLPEGVKVKSVQLPRWGKLKSVQLHLLLTV